MKASKVLLMMDKSKKCASSFFFLYYVSSVPRRSLPLSNCCSFPCFFSCLNDSVLLSFTFLLYLLFLSVKNNNNNNNNNKQRDSIVEALVCVVSSFTAVQFTTVYKRQFLTSI